MQIVQSEHELPASLNDGKGGIRGVYDPETDLTWMVADNLSAADAPGVFLHELGVHFGLERMVGSRKYQDIIAEVKRMEAAGNPAALAARAAIPKGTRQAAVDDELVAYLVEKHPELPLVKRIIAAIRAFLFRHGLIKNIRPEDVVALARAAARHAARGAVVNRAGSVAGLAPAYSGSPLWYSEMAKFIDAKAPGKAPAAQWKGLLKGWAKQGKFKGDELEFSGVKEWLDLQTGPVTKDQVLEFLREDGVTIEETELGEPAKQVWRDWSRALRDKGLNASDAERIGHAVIAGDENAIDEAYQYGVTPEDVASRIATKEHTKFAQWQLPGGDNYRELLLRLPEAPASPGFRDASVRLN
ncbi:MAG: hypothetical protein ACR2M4_00195 [Actinomycetota bacterium]